MPQLSQPADKKSVTRYAEELDEQAARLEKQAVDMRGAKASLGRELVNGGVARTSQASGSASALDFATAHDAGLAFAAGVTIAEGKSVAVDLAPKIAVGINDENRLVILAVQFTDHGLFRLFTAAGKGLDSPEAPTLLAGDPKAHR
jgi:hypothetical protein